MSTANDAVFSPENAQMSPNNSTTEAVAKDAAAGGSGDAQGGPIDEGCRRGLAAAAARRISAAAWSQRPPGGAEKAQGRPPSPHGRARRQEDGWQSRRGR